MPVRNFFVSLFMITLVACSGGGSSSGSGSGSDSNTGDDTDTPLPASVKHKEVQTGGSAGSTDVTTSAALAAMPGELYLAAVSSNPQRDVVSVTGLGLSWVPVGDQCAARVRTGISVWRAIGNPSSADTVTARFASVPTNAAITVSRYAGVDAAEPLGALVSANTNGPGGACSGGLDSSSYTVDLNTSEADSLVFAAVAMRQRLHRPGPSYIERVETMQGGGAGAASLAVQDVVLKTPRTTSVSGSFNSSVDWAVLAVEVKPVGSSTPLPDLRVEPASHDYNTVLIAVSTSQTFRLHNDGNADLIVSATSIGGADAGEFMIDAGGAPFALVPGATRDITVNLFPTAVGSPSAFLRIESDDPDESPLDVALSGKVVDRVESDIAVDPASHNYGSVNIATSRLATFSVSNNGLADLNVDATSLSGANASLFTIESGMAPFMLAPRAAKDIAVRFDPVAEGGASATLEITSDDFDQPQVDLPLSGSGAMVQDGIWISAPELAGLPMSGPAWDEMKATADGDLDFKPVSDLNSNHDTQTLAVGLVYARTGGAFYRQKARDEIEAAIGTEVITAQAVGACRNVVSYVITADLIDLASFDPTLDATFRNWIDQIRFVIWPDGSVIAEDEERTNNHGRMCGAARAAIAVYLDDQADLDRAATVFAGMLGDRTAYDDFHWKHDLSWQADETNPVGVNPVGAVKQGLSIDGALTEEMRRGGSFAIPPVQTGYPWEALQGILVEAVILERAGYFDVFDWSDRAILRIVQFLERLDTQFPNDGWWATGDDTWVPWVINQTYGTSYPTEKAKYGKLMGWTGWTHAP